MAELGTELKINVKVEPMGNIHLSACEFECYFFVYTNKNIKVSKSEMIQVDDDNFIALVDTKNLGAGALKMTIVVDVPDGDFNDNLRREVETVCTGITITKVGVCQ